MVKFFSTSSKRGVGLMIGLLVAISLVRFIFVFFPICYSFFLSFTRYSLMKISFIGLQNYLELFQDKITQLVFWNTFYFAATSVPLNVFLSLSIALCIYQVPRLKSFFRLSFFLPVATSMVAVSIVWKWVYEPQLGLLNNILIAMHLKPLGWLRSSALAMPSIVLMSVWKDMGYNVILFLAGLNDIPKVFYEAAQVDGANRWTLFRNVTWPLLRPTFAFVLIVTARSAFQVFTQVYVMTGGGPENSTRVAVLHMYLVGFQNIRMGYASAIAFVLLIIIFSFSLIQLRVFKTSWTY